MDNTITTLETYKGLYIDLSSLPLDSIEMERLSLRSQHYFLRSFARLLYRKDSYLPPSQEDLDRRQRERSQLEAPIVPSRTLKKDTKTTRDTRNNRDTSAFD